MMKCVADPGDLIPGRQSVQIIPDRMILVLIRDQAEGFIHCRAVLDAVGVFEIQMHGAKITVGQCISFVLAFPGKGTGHINSLCQDVIPELTVKLRIMPKDPGTVHSAV